MPYNIVTAGGNVYLVSSVGLAQTPFTLPSGVTVSASIPARMAVLDKFVVIVNGSSRSLLVKTDQVNGAVYPLMVPAPVSPPVVASGSAGLLTGTFKVKYTFIIKDPVTGALLVESDFSPISAAVTVSTQKINVTGIETSPDSSVTGRRLYRTTTGPGTTYFQWIDLDGNTATSISDDLLDASLSVTAAPTNLGSAPGAYTGTTMTNIVEWKGRLWGVGDVDVDTLRYSAADSTYQWPASFSFDITPLGRDQFGITGLLRRRDELGIAKRDILWKIVGTDETDFQTIKVREGPGKGVWATDSVRVIDDVAYFLGETGVYTWGPGGVESISDEFVRGWFTTDTYFNRAQFVNAIGAYNPKYHWYMLVLCAAGGTVPNRWVAYDINSGKWWGPHKTSAIYAITASGLVVDANNANTPVFGTGDGWLYSHNSSTFLDDASAIEFDIVTKPHDANTPDITKIWLQPSVISQIQSGAGNCQLIATVGSLSLTNTQTQSVDMTKDRQRLVGRLGTGQYCQLEFKEATASQGCGIFGYQIPVFEAGRR